MQSIQKQSRRGGESEPTGETALNMIVDLNPNVKGLNFFFLRQRLSDWKKTKYNHVSFIRAISTYKDTERLQVNWWGKKHVKT